MRLSIAVVPVLVSIIVLFSGCISGPKPTTTTIIPTTAPTTTIPYVEAKNIAYNAIEKQDVNTCDQMQEQVKRDWCYRAVGVTSLDDSVCAKITDHPLHQSSCYMGVAIAKNDISICDKISVDDSSIAPSTRTRCRDVVNGDLSVCSRLVASQQDSCYLILGTALKDLSLCEKIVNADTHDLCTEQVTTRNKL